MASSPVTNGQAVHRMGGENKSMATVVVIYKGKARYFDGNRQEDLIEHVNRSFQDGLLKLDDGIYLAG